MDDTPSNASPPTRPTASPPDGKSKPHGAGTSSASPQGTPTIKHEEDEENALATQSIDAYDQGYESSVDAPVIVIDDDIQLELEEEKRSYPGASSWAAEEERLFEILFQRATTPLLPAHWDVDFRGIPVIDSIFAPNDETQPIIYSRSPKKEFQATTALIRLIDLTSFVRTTVQSGLRNKAAPLVKRTLDRYIAWAAEDGGYSHLRTVPNITTAVVDAELGEEDITSTMERRMRALAMAQREFLKVGRDSEAFWDVSAVRGRLKDADLGALLVEKYMARIEEASATPRASSKQHARVSNGDTTPAGPGASLCSPSKGSVLEKERHHTGAGEEYIHQPPVVYGLFILRTSVFLLTVDSAKGDSAYVSFHVDMHFMDRHQSVWNALTAAIVVCMARDQLVERMELFDEGPPSVEESGSEA